MDTARTLQSSSALMSSPPFRTGSGSVHRDFRLIVDHDFR